MIDPIYITGAGIISAIGVGKQATLDSLLKRHSGIAPIRYLETVHNDFLAGEVSMSNEEMMQYLNIPFDLKLSRSALMGRIALAEALQQASLTNNQLRVVHLLSATTVGGIDRREVYHANELECDQLHAVIATHNCGDCTQMIARHFGDFASLSTISTACSSASNAIILGANMLRCRLAEIVIVGGTECLSKFHLNGFNSLMILDKQLCRPFDQLRAGLNLGEGAAYLVMESAVSVKRRGVEPIARLCGYGNACDAFHQTASSPNGDGARFAMQQALNMAGVLPSDINYINAHGTGTPNNDESESNAIMHVFGEHYPAVSSTKGYTGHTTSASGSIEAVFCLMALEHQFLPPNINWSNPMVNGFVPVTDMHSSKPIKFIQSNAFGFGGNDSSLIFSTVDAI